MLYNAHRLSFVYANHDPTTARFHTHHRRAAARRAISRPRANTGQRRRGDEAADDHAGRVHRQRLFHGGDSPPIQRRHRPPDHFPPPETRHLRAEQAGANPQHGRFRDVLQHRRTQVRGVRGVDDRRFQQRNRHALGHRPDAHPRAFRHRDDEDSGAGCRGVHRTGRGNRPRGGEAVRRSALR